MSIDKMKAKLWSWWLFVSIATAGSFVFPVSSSSDFSSLLNGILLTVVTFYGLRYIYRKFIFKLIFGYTWTKSREEFVMKS